LIVRFIADILGSLAQFYYYLQIAEEAGIPAGVFNIIPCSRDNVDEVTDVVMESNLVRKFSFTGSTTVGKVSRATG
jgi:acyl-CoA reductase-like NAD-dependent aldehyde dehydrogenase